MNTIEDIKNKVKELDGIVDVKNDKLYFVLKLFMDQIKELSSVKMSQKKQVEIFSKVFDRKIPPTSYRSFYDDYILLKERKRKPKKEEEVSTSERPLKVKNEAIVQSVETTTNSSKNNEEENSKNPLTEKNEITTKANISHKRLPDDEL